MKTELAYIRGRWAWEVVDNGNVLASGKADTDEVATAEGDAWIAEHGASTFPPGYVGKQEPFFQFGMPPAYGTILGSCGSLSSFTSAAESAGVSIDALKSQMALLPSAELHTLSERQFPVAEFVERVMGSEQSPRISFDGGQTWTKCQSVSMQVDRDGRASAAIVTNPYTSTCQISASFDLRSSIPITKPFIPIDEAYSQFDGLTVDEVHERIVDMLDGETK